MKCRARERSLSDLLTSNTNFALNFAVVGVLWVQVEVHSTPTGHG